MSSGLPTTHAMRIISFITALCALSIAGCDQSKNDLATPKYSATVTKTEFGIPHITADSWGSLGFGEAYTAAEDQLCNMALALVQSRGESAAVFGSGPKNRNVSRDIVVKALAISEKSQRALAEQTPQIREWIEGYAAGYSQYVTEQQGNFGAWCDQADWVRPATAEEFMAQYVTLVYTLPRIAGAITAALFLKRFVSNQTDWVHFDLMAYNTKTRPARPEGGEAMGLRAVYSYLEEAYA